jgi:DNA-binding SARP family transcriptional activator/tetratricopeptide (TPR) repeat protein
MVDASYHLKVLGYPELRSGSGQAVQLKVRKHLALLVYLAVDDRTWHRRDALAELLWHSVSSERGRHSLSMALSVLRSALGRGSIAVKASCLRLRRGLLSIDLSTLRKSQTDAEVHHEPQEIERFLEGFELPHCPAFQHWREAIDAATTPLLRTRLHTAIFRAREAGNADALLRVGAYLSNLDPLDEEGIRARMEGLALQNDRLGALRLYEAWTAMAAREIRLTPSEGLQRLSTVLRQPPRAVALATLNDRSPSVNACQSTFAGREKEFARLFEGWRAVAAGSTKRFAIIGDIGIGKSSLASRLATALQFHGATVVQKRLSSSEQLLSLGLAASLLRDLLECPGAMATDPGALAALSRIATPPHHTSRLTSTLGSYRQSAETVSLASALGALLDAITDEQPLALILDDVLFTDPESLALLHHAILQRTRPILFVVTHRPFNLADTASVRQNRASLQTFDAEVIPLDTLSEAESIQIVATVVAQHNKRLGPVARRAILRASSGNPWSLTFLTRDWLEHDENSLALALPAMRNCVLGDLADTAAHDALLDRITPELAPRTRLALQLAAVLGPRMNESDIFAVAGLSARQTVAAIAELCEYRLLCDRGDRLVFWSDLLRWRVYTRTTPTIRRRLHQHVVSHLQAHCASNTPDLEMAWHLMRAGNVSDSIPLLLRGSANAVVTGAPDEAVHALTSALAHLTGVQRGQALVLLADAYQEMAEWQASLDALSQIDDNHAWDTSTSELRQILEIEARRHTQLTPTWEAREVLGRLIDAIRSMDSPAGRARAAICAARMADAVKDQDLTVRLQEALLTVQKASLSPREEGMLRLAQAMVDYYGGALDRSRDGTIRLCHFLDEHHTSDSTFAVAMTGLGALACASGNYEDGLSAFKRAHQVARRLDNESLQDGVAGNLALCNHRLGNYEEGRMWARGAMSEDASPIRQFIAAKTAVLHGQSSVFLRDVAAAEESLDKLDQVAAGTHAEWVLQATLLMKADLLWLLRRRRQARTAARDAMHLGDGPLATGITGVYARWLANTAGTGGSKVERIVHLRKLYSNRQVLDAIDRAELGCALLMLQAQLGLSDPSLAAQTRQDLSILPAACAAQLKLLGLSLPNCGADAIPEASLRP